MLTVVSFSQRMSWTYPLWAPQQEIKLSIVFEGKISTEKGEINSYSIAWLDTLGTKNGYNNFNKPMELKVVIRDKDTIVGSYTGASLQLNHTYILTNSKKVTVHFWLDHNQFFQRKQKEPEPFWVNDSTRVTNIKRIELFSDLIFYQPRMYAPFTVNLSERNQNIIEGFQEKTILLEKNPNYIALNYQNVAPLKYPMPQRGPTYKGTLVLNQYQINLTTGKIRKGWFWLRFRGIRKCCDIEFGIVDPHIIYENNSGKKYSGRKLIKKRSISPDKFDLYQFQDWQESLPYE
jgi:hypothetical protein